MFYNTDLSSIFQSVYIEKNLCKLLFHTNQTLYLGFIKKKHPLSIWRCFFENLK